MKFNAYDLTIAERHALTNYNLRYGRNWKRNLRNFWMNETQDQPWDNEKHGPILRSLRNKYGPSWLESVRITKVKQTMFG